MLIVNGNVFVVLSELNDAVPNEKFVVEVPFTFTVTFPLIDDDELFKYLSSDPTKFNEYVFPDAEYAPSLTLTSFAHVGFVESVVTVYVFASLVFPDVSTNTPAFIIISIVPPV